jgi:hypothetical protein
VFLGLPNDRKFLALARYRLGHLFPTLIDQSGYNRRLRALAPQIARAINYLTFTSPSFYDNLRLLDSTAGPCGQSRETARRSEFAGYAGYGYCRSHSRFFWGFRLQWRAKTAHRQDPRPDPRRVGPADAHDRACPSARPLARQHGDHLAVLTSTASSTRRASVCT